MTRRGLLALPFFAVLLPAVSIDSRYEAPSLAPPALAPEVTPAAAPDGMQEGCDAIDKVKLELRSEYHVDCEAVEFELLAANDWKVPVKVYISVYDDQHVRQGLLGGDSLEAGTEKTFTGRTPCHKPLGALKINVCWATPNCRCTWPR